MLYIVLFYIYMIWYHVILYCIISGVMLYSILRYHILLYDIISYHIISYHVILYNIRSYYIMLYYIILYYINSILYCIIVYHVISYHIIICCMYIYICDCVCIRWEMATEYVLHYHHDVVPIMQVFSPTSISRSSAVHLPETITTSPPSTVPVGLTGLYLRYTAGSTQQILTAFHPRLWRWLGMSRPAHPSARRRTDTEGRCRQTWPLPANAPFSWQPGTKWKSRCSNSFIA